MNEFIERLNKLYNAFGNHKTMVLSTSLNDKVSSRMMSVILIDGAFYFQTDRVLKKYNQIKKNENVALCIDNISIEGVCSEVGSPIDNGEFCSLYREYYPKAYEMYSGLGNEVLFCVRPVFIERWIYENGKPFVEVYNINEAKYIKKEYRIYGEVNDN